jgi:transcriptional regulator with XRE-family HTH domain
MISDLQVFRKRRGISQGQMAALLNVSRSMVSMVENEQRELPAAAVEKFVALQQQEQYAIKVPGMFTSNDFHSLKNMHMREAEEYLLSYKKDCETALHKHEKLVRNWTKRYEKAVVQFCLAENPALLDPGNNFPKQFQIEIERERLAATETLIQIGRQKPELTMVKIAGLKQELRTIKTMLGKQKRYLGMKDTGLPFYTRNTNLPFVVKKTQPPEIDRGEAAIAEIR